MKKTYDPNVTLRDIALQAGTTVSTVSRAISADPRISKEKAEAIRLMASRMGYCPKPMRRKVSNSIGLIVVSDEGQNTPEDQNQTLWSAGQVAAKCNKHIHLEFVSSAARQGDLPKCVKENRVDGVVVVSHSHPDFYQELKLFNVPVVSLADPADDAECDAVHLMLQPAMNQLIQMLSTLGHRKISLVTADSTPADRQDVFLAALQDCGLTMAPNHLVSGLPATIEGGVAGIARLADAGALPTAIVFGDDWMAMGGLMELEQRGLRVPEDISIVGMGNRALCDQSRPRLTSLDMNPAGMIRRAFDMISERLAGLSCPPRQESVDAQVAWRQSCAIRASH